MCSYIVEKARMSGSAKGPSGWMRIDTANVYYDHPYHAPLEHAVGIDFICEADGGRERVAVEISRESALALIETIKAALARRRARQDAGTRAAGAGGIATRDGELVLGATMLRLILAILL